MALAKERRTREFPANCLECFDAIAIVSARERGWPVLASDPDDLLAIDPTLTVGRIESKEWKVAEF